MRASWGEARGGASHHPSGEQRAQCTGRCRFRWRKGAPHTQIQGLCRLQGDRRPVGVWGRDRRMSLSLTLVSEACVKGPCPQPSPGSRLGTEPTAPCHLALAQSLHSWAGCRESGRALGVKARSCWWSRQAGPPCFKTDAEATGEKWPSG